MADCELMIFRRTTDNRHTQCEAMSAHYEVCILLIEFEEDKFGMRVSYHLTMSI